MHTNCNRVYSLECFNQRDDFCIPASIMHKPDLAEDISKLTIHAHHTQQYGTTQQYCIQFLTHNW